MLNELKEILRYAPKDPGPIADGLVAWRLPDNAGFVCAKCAGRIFARGCRLPNGSTAVWADTIDAPLACGVE